MSSEFNENNYSLKMSKTIQSFRKDIHIKNRSSQYKYARHNKSWCVGQQPIEQLGTISVPEARLISIQVWDKSNTSLIESTIQKSELGINPQVDGQVIRLRIPDLTERRKELIKVLKNMGEKGKVAIKILDEKLTKI